MVIWINSLFKSRIHHSNTSQTLSALSFAILPVIFLQRGSCAVETFLKPWLFHCSSTAIERSSIPVSLTLSHCWIWPSSFSLLFDLFLLLQNSTVLCFPRPTTNKIPKYYIAVSNRMLYLIIWSPASLWGWFNRAVSMIDQFWDAIITMILEEWLVN